MGWFNVLMTEFIVACVAGYCFSPIHIPFLLPLYPLPLSTPARKQKRDVDWGETVTCHAGYYKFSHKHIKPTHTGNLLIDAHNMTHLSLSHPTETTLGVLFSIFILLHQKFLQFDWLRAGVFQLNLKYLHVKITKLLRVAV